ncbi:Flavodoxin [Clostridium sp. USBA 49]|uniref:EFR1 family ferrodoxin n=1 Tax=Clostridium sp. USBA 49 TaxID=1881060 RepID=UPI00099A11D5|nr:EFR1 family ferrodoxin [Clostridium sp. USBA 49]SKA91601.1 Flavodoxin [Clostridium sp. USBA 49]
MKGILYYFSGTGNTKWVAGIFQKEFEKFSQELDIKSIERVEKVELDECEYVIIGTPVYGELPPKIVIDFIDKFPQNTSNIKFILYSTQGSKKSAAIDYISKILKKKGYDVFIEVSFKMANSYYFGFGEKISKEEIDKYLKDAEKKVKNIVEEFSKGNKVIEKVSVHKRIYAKIYNHSFNKLLPKLSSKLSSTNECKKCDLCLKNCPNGNITIERGQVSFHSNCMMCLRCIHLCPYNAIRYKGKKIEQIMKDRIKILDLR